MASITYAQALLIARKALESIQQALDIILMKEIFQAVCRTDVWLLVREAWRRVGAELDTIKS
ncbi:MAG: hypothetical protein ABI045_04985 [Flavobacteriales bacterium]